MESQQSDFFGGFGGGGGFGDEDMFASRGTLANKAAKKEAKLAVR
jgi:hypothetical protein